MGYSPRKIRMFSNKAMGILNKIEKIILA